MKHTNKKKNSSYGVTDLSKKTKRYKELEEKLVPVIPKNEYRQMLEIYRSCPNPYSGDCDPDICEHFARCAKEHLLKWVAVPQYIYNPHILSKISGNAAKVLLYIIHRANYRNDADDEDYGKCLLTYPQINAATGVSQNNMKKYVDELVNVGLIRKEVRTIGGGYKDIRKAVEITFLWYPRKRKLKKIYDELVYAQDNDEGS